MKEDWLIFAHFFCFCDESNLSLPRVTLEQHLPLPDAQKKGISFMKGEGMHLQQLFEGRDMISWFCECCLSRARKKWVKYQLLHIGSIIGPVCNGGGRLVSFMARTHWRWDGGEPSQCLRGTMAMTDKVNHGCCWCILLWRFVMRFKSVIFNLNSNVLSITKIQIMGFLSTFPIPRYFSLTPTYFNLNSHGAKNWSATHPQPSTV